MFANSPPSRWPVVLVLLALCFLAATQVAADVNPPAEVTGLKAAKSRVVSGVVELVWEPVTTDIAGNPKTVDTYNVYRGDTPDFVPDRAGGSNLAGTSSMNAFADPGAVGDPEDYYYLVSAVDAGGNEGRTRAPKVLTPPVLSGFWTDTTIEVDWTDAEPQSEVAGYRVYYGRASRIYEFVEDVGLTNSHSLTGLELWVNWYIAVTALDHNGNESDFSNEVVDAVAGRVRVRAHDETELCWGADKCPPDVDQVQRRDGWQLMVPVDFPEGDWQRVLVTYTIDSRLCTPPAGNNVTKCGSGNPCENPPCNGGYNTCGDPWDRGAHLFLVLDDCITAGGNCKTNENLELMRAITPFGTDAPPPEGTGVIPPRELTLDVTPYAPLLTGTRYVGAEIGHYVQTGFWVTVDFEFSERNDEASPKPPADGIQVLFYGGAEPPTATLDIPATATQVITRLFTTGHGGSLHCDGGPNNAQPCNVHADCLGWPCYPCDEFCHRMNQIIVDGTPVWEHEPWRDDCSPASNPCNNWNACGFPSCTYPRAGWCPGYIACHQNPPCDQDLDMTVHLAPGATYDVDYNVTPLNGSWSVSLVAYWYE